MHNIKVGLADDHNLFREGIRVIITGMQGITLCIEASGGTDLLAQLKETSVDIVLLDLEMKDLNGIDTLKILAKEYPDIKVIILSMHTEPRMISYMMESGAKGYVQKDARKEELEKVIRTVFEKGVYFDEQISNSLLAGLISKGKKPSIGIDLSAREREVLNLICQEYTTQEIGEKLFISDRTVEGHRKNLLVKLDVRNVAGLVKKAILMKLIDVY